jgi:hypothetical protein
MSAGSAFAWNELEAQCVRNGRECADGWIGAVRTEQPTDCLGGDVGSSSKFRFRETHRSAPFVESTDEAVNLIDATTSLVVGPDEGWVLSEFREVAVGTRSGWSRHSVNVT